MMLKHTKRAAIVVAFLGWGALAVAGPWPVRDGAKGSWERTDAGLEVLDVAEGEGDEAVAGATVEVHYTGMLANGAVFDSSVERGQPFAFRIGAGKVIRGWEEGVQGMRVGGKRRLVVPPELGYGDRAAGPIPPGSTLYFEIELLRVLEAPPPVADGPRTLDDGAFKRSRTGLVWADVQKGEGDKPKSNRRVCVSYSAWSGGELVDDTRSKGRCWWFRFEHDAVVQGLTEGLAKMREGGVRQLHVPPELLRGDGPNGAIQADGVVVFEVELVEATE